MSRIPISQFKDKFLKNGLSSPTKYHVIIDGPNIGSSKDKILQPEAVTLPSKSFLTFPEELYGPPRQIPLRKSFEGNVTMTFPVSETWEERSFFEKWMDMIVDPGTGFSQYPGPGNNGHAQMIIFTLSQN